MKANISNVLVPIKWSKFHARQFEWYSVYYEIYWYAIEKKTVRYSPVKEESELISITESKHLDCGVACGREFVFFF